MISPLLDPIGYIRVGGAALRRIVFEAAVGRRVVRRRDDDAVGKSLFSISIVNLIAREIEGVGVKPSSR